MLTGLFTWLLEQAASLLWRRWFHPRSDVEKAHDIEDKNHLAADGAAIDELRTNWQRD